MLQRIRSRYVLKDIFDHLDQYPRLALVRYNLRLQNKLEMTLKDYMDYGQIEILLKPKPITQLKYGKKVFINIKDKNEYKIYFNSDVKHRRRTYITRADNVNIIKVVIGKKVKSFNKLFYGCHCLLEIKFTKFMRNDIVDMSNMFGECSSLTYLDVSKLKTDNVTDMSYMFSGCYSLTSIDVSKFNTNHVINMNYMFESCSSLTNLDVSNFNTNNVADMNCMFSKCYSLPITDINKFHVRNDNLKNCIFNGNRQK